MSRVESAEILAAARTWLGTPWRHQGRLKGVAMDCGGLILGVGRDLGLLDFDTRAYGRIPDGRLLRAVCEQHLVPKPVTERATRHDPLDRYRRGHLADGVGSTASGCHRRSPSRAAPCEGIAQACR
jgi:hypothetical protein